MAGLGAVRGDSTTTQDTTPRLEGVDSLTHFWSITLPRAIDRFAPSVADALADGAWTAAWRGVASLAPVVALLVGFLAPRYWPSLELRVYSSSVSFLIVAIAAGLLSGATGVMLVVGYVAGDLFSNPFDPSVYQASTSLAFDPFWGKPALLAIRRLASLVISYALLGALVVTLPQLARRMAEDVAQRLPQEPTARVIVRAGTYAALAVVLVYVWSQGTVMLIRPLATFMGTPSVPREFFAVLQSQWQMLVIAAAVVAVTRVSLAEYVTRRSPRAPMIMELRRQRWLDRWGRRSIFSRLPLGVRVVLASLATAALLAGITDNFLDWIVAAVIIAVLYAWRSGLFGSLTAPWDPLAARVPAAARFVLVLAVGYWLTATYIDATGGMLAQGQSFRPLLAGSLLVLILLALVFPRPSVIQSNEGTRTP